MSPHQYRWETSEKLPPEAACIDEGLTDFNQRAAGLDAVRQFACLTRTTGGEVVGGAVARSWGACCELQQLWVADEHRFQGVGRQLVGMVESHARRLGCTELFLETFSFQAPEFYRKLGYTDRCEISGFPNGISKFLLSRQLTRTA